MHRTLSPFPSAALLALGLALLAAVVPRAAADEKRPIVVTTNTILTDMVREIAGSDVETHCLVQRGIDLHGFAPRPADVAMLSRASMVVANGAGLEPWLDKLVATAGFKGRIVEAAESCTLIERGGHEHEGHMGESDEDHGHGHMDAIDPHAWQDPANGIRYVESISQGLCEIDPEHASAYVERTRAYTAALRQLDGEIRARFERIPPEQRCILTSHDALAYFGQAYGLRIVPLRGLDLLQEPDARQIAAITDELRAQKIRAIFVEAVSNPKMLEQLARDTGVALGGELYTGSVGPEGSPAGTYVGMLRENANRVATALESSIR